MSPAPESEASLPVSLDQQSLVVAKLDALPTDIILHICGYFPGWRDVLGLLKVSPALYNLYHHREIWSLLVSDTLNALDTPRIYHLDRPLYCYDGQELRDMFIRWQVSRNVWKDNSMPRDVNNSANALLISKSAAPSGIIFELPLDTQGRSFLTPGGRWLVVLTDAVSAVYYDLDGDTGTQHVLFDTQLPLMHSNGALHMRITLPDIEPCSPLKFRFAITFNSTSPDDSASSCVLQVWEVSVIMTSSVDLDSRSNSRECQLSSTLLASVPLPAPLGGVCSSVKALSGDNVVVDIPQLRLGSATTCLSIIDWRTAGHADRFRRRVILFSDIIHGAMPVGSHSLLVASRRGIFLYDYRRSVVVRSFSGKGVDETVDPDRSIFCEYIAKGKFHFISPPVDVPQSDGSVLQKLACCNDTGEMYSMCISPRSTAAGSEKDSVESWYLGNNPARKAFKKAMALKTSMSLGVNLGVIMERSISKVGRAHLRPTVIYYERETLKRLTTAVSNGLDEFSVNGSVDSDYVIGQVISREVPLNLAPLLEASSHVDTLEYTTVLFFDESIARIALHCRGHLQVINL